MNRNGGEIKIKGATDGDEAKLECRDKSARISFT